MTEIHLIDLQEQPVVGRRQQIRMDQIAEIFETTLNDVLQAIRAAGATTAGAPYARYFGKPAETADVEVGFPVTEPFTATGDLVVSVLPAARAAEAIHRGPYDRLVETYREMELWAQEHKVVLLEEAWEIYEAGPESDPDPATWRTRILYPVSPPQVEQGEGGTDT
ncbi:GyrI-like domain-containing protein [Georgenia sp. AZ-5]|uniref:GyrI-like domain-containing protein n=1 Tax=Georgenia sp. AZ-5 TaxID=3367526 RepID=UPI003754D9B3